MYGEGDWGVDEVVAPVAARYDMIMLAA